MVKQATQQNELHKKLWTISNELRNNMDANDFKNYILGLIFYRYLSENLESIIENEYLNGEDISYEQAWENEKYKKALETVLTEESELGYLIEPKYLYSKMVKLIEEGKFDIGYLREGISHLENSTLNKASEGCFDGLFEDMDLFSNKLGKGEKERSKLIASIILRVSEIDFRHDEAEIDVLGDAYEYLIGQFAADAGKKAGEFYTPQAVSEILARIVSEGRDNLQKVYDPTCGSGSLLLRVSKYSNIGHYYGQEKSPTTYNLARMNMLLHKVSFDRIHIENGNTLENPAEDHRDLKFDAIVANPPYSANWTADDSFNTDPRFVEYEKLAPKSKADFAFVQHMLYHLKNDGRMAVVLPHGVLFRGGAEGTIRKHIVDKRGYLDAVIGLPANLFFGTGIPTCILVFNKTRNKKDDIMFIDASKEFEKVKTKNILTANNIDKIVTTYFNKSDIEKYSRLVPLSEIYENDFNLNIPRYVDTFEEEEEIDLEAVANKIIEIDKEMIEIDKEIKKFCEELGIKAPVL